MTRHEKAKAWLASRRFDAEQVEALVRLTTAGMCTTVEALSDDELDQLARHAAAQGITDSFYRAPTGRLDVVIGGAQPDLFAGSETA